MRQALHVTLGIVIAAAILLAADPVWKTTPAARWTEEDVRQILTKSPWARVVRGTVTRRLTEDQLREAGQMGQPTGIGYDGVDAKGSGPVVSPNVFQGPGGDDRSARSINQPITLAIRWETALPVRLAELKSHDEEPPVLEGDGYRVAVYGVPGGKLKGEPEQLGEPLKNFAALKRDGKKDVKPLRVEVFQRNRELVIVYLFPWTAEITAKDRRLEFQARVGRIVLSQDFDLAEMEFQGKLEL